MKSDSRFHFPPVRLQGEEKRLWNPIQKKSLVNRPEERVRLRYIDYLTLQIGWSASRISSETGLEKGPSGGTPRADLIGYNRSFQPAFLIECKAENIALDLSAAEQVALYNRHLNAPLVCLTNGRQEYWFEHQSGEIRRLERHPFPEKVPLEKIRRSRDYWIRRGSLGNRPLFESPEADARLLSAFWSIERSDRRYLEIPYRYDSLALSHDYLLFRLEGASEIACTILADSEGGTQLVGIRLTGGNADRMIVADLSSGRDGEKTPSVRRLEPGSRPSETDHNLLIPTSPDAIEEWAGELPKLLVQELT